MSEKPRIWTNCDVDEFLKNVAVHYFTSNLPAKQSTYHCVHNCVVFPTVFFLTLLHRWFQETCYGTHIRLRTDVRVSCCEIMQPLSQKCVGIYQVPKNL